MIDFITLGCSKNLVDSEQLMRQFKALGYAVRHDATTPDGEIVVINTCGFIGDAKEESIEMILQFAEQKRAGKLKKLFVMGCLSQRYLSELSIEVPEVDKFYGKFNFQELIADLGHIYRPDLALERVITTPPHYAYVKIAEGCNRTCSYCAIPIITGRYQSRPIESIVDEVKWLTTQGVKEFQIIAQDLSYYGKDLYKKYNLAELIARLSDIKGVEWLRLHYAYPTQFPLDVLRVMRERDNVCKYLDIALQHISDNMLNVMRRNCTAAQTYDLIDTMRHNVPQIHLRTTLLVGHPYETEADFEALKNFVAKVRFERLGVFAYSHEEGTFGYKNYEDKIPNSVKQERVSTIMALQQTIANEINAQKVGQTLRVIVDRKEGNEYIGRTQYDSPEVDGEVIIAAQKNILTGNFYNVKITDSSEFDLFGEIV